MGEQDFLDPNAQAPMEAQPEAQPAVAPEGAPGNPMEQITGGGMGNVAPNPFEGEAEPASPQEQEQYQDAFKRVMAMVHDTRDPPNGGKSMADGIIKKISNPEFPSYVSLGGTAGDLMQMFHNNAKRQKVEFPGDVLMAVGQDLVVELMDVGRVTGAVKDLPPEESPEEEEFARLATLEASKVFGDYMLNTGQVDSEQAKNDYMEQMEREATSGALDDWDMKEMDPEQLNAAVAQQKGVV